MEEKRQKEARLVLYRVFRGFRALIFLSAPFLISGYIWFCYMNPISYLEKTVSIIAGLCTVGILFFVELSIFDP